MKKRRAFEVFTLSFLDCICCGFGAVVLFYTIVQAQKGAQDILSLDRLTGEVSKLEEEVKEGTMHLVQLRNTLEKTDTDASAAAARAARVAAELTARQIARPLFNVVISNVPGPPMDIYTGGARLEALFPLSVIADGTGLNVTIMSYRDSVDIGITADREQTPDVQTIVDGMRAELDAIVAATAPKAKPAPKPRTRPKRPAAKSSGGG